MNFAPIALFAFNRPAHLEKTLESLAKNLGSSESILHIFLDGPKSSLDETNIISVRKIAERVSGFKDVKIHSSPFNKGLANSIIDGVTMLTRDHGKVIVLEDDMVTSPYFITFMNDSLLKFEFDERVISIHGYLFPFEKKMAAPFFLKGADCWGWATWKRGWDYFEVDALKLANELTQKKLIKEFNYNNSYDYFQMLTDFIKGKNNSWAVRWYASAFLSNKLTLYPNHSLVLNIGLDSSGTHCEETNAFNVNLSKYEINLDNVIVEESLEARRYVERFYKSQNTVISRLKTRMKKILS